MSFINDLSDDKENFSYSDHPRPRKIAKIDPLFDLSGHKPRRYKNPPLKEIVPIFEEGSFPTLELIFFDIETSGFDHRHHEILQLSALTLSGEDKFNRYVQPEGRIAFKAFMTHGLQFDKEAGQMSKHGVDLPGGVVSLLEALEQFLKFCSDVSPTNQIALVAHNAQFDAKFLLKSLEKENLLSQFEEKCLGFVDTMRAAEKLQPKRKNGKDAIKPTLFALYQFHGGEELEDFHDSEVDVECLRFIWPKMGKPEQYLPFTFQLKQFLHYMEISDNGKSMEPMLNIPFRPDIKLTVPLITKLAKAGANMASLAELAAEGKANFIQGISNLDPKIKSQTSVEIFRAVKVMAKTGRDPLVDQAIN